MGQRWAIWLTVEGDLRFLSHHDTMRAIERVAARANLPLVYTQGFNPRPRMSLVCPRPVGVASRADLLVVALAEPVSAEDIRDRLNGARTPPGMRFTGAAPLTGKIAPQCSEARCELPIDPADESGLLERIDQLQREPNWPIERSTPPARHKRRDGARTKSMDLRPFVADLTVSRGTLQWTQRYVDQQSARPREVLRLLHLNERLDCAMVTRTRAAYCQDGNAASRLEPVAINEP